MTVFLSYSSEPGAKVKWGNPGISFRGIGSKLGDTWRTSPEKKDKAADKKPLALLPSSSSNSKSGIQNSEQQANINVPTPPREHAVMYVSDFTTDTELQELIMTLAASEEDPPLLFAWNYPALLVFWAKAVAYATIPSAVPIPINGGVSLAVAPDIALLQTKRLEFVSVELLLDSPPTLIAGTIGLACTQQQSLMAAGFLCRLELKDWFAAVLQHGHPLPGPLASIWTPRATRHPSGVCEPLLFSCTLWV